MTDPGTSTPLGGLKTDLPLILLPMRLETRFSADGAQILVRVYPDTIHVDSFEPELTTTELTWGKHYWEQTWKAGGNEARERSAWAQLAERFGGPRAAWIAEALDPQNPNSRPTKPIPPDSPLPTQPQFRTPTGRPSAWERAAVTRVLPDRWVALGYLGGRRVFTFWGNPIPDPLAVGPNPKSGFDAASIAADPSVGWLVDFVKAESVGMGLRVPYVLPAGSKLDRLVVLGVRPSLSGSDSQARLERLLRAHHYTDGLAFVLPGTLTNNTSDAPSGYSTWDPSYATSYRVERRGPGRPADPESNRGVVGRALGVDDAVFARVAEGAGVQERDARHMNNALWQATWGYFLEQLLSGPGSPSDAAIRQGRQHFGRFVRAGGPVPALRVGSQPYGLLPALALDRWKSREGVAADAPVVGLLRSLLPYWRNSLAFVPSLPAGTSSAGGRAAPDQILAEILAMSPVSLRYVARPGQLATRLPISTTASGPTAGSGAAQDLKRRLGLGWTPRQVRMVFGAYPVALALDGALVQGPLPEVLSETTPPEYVRWLAQSTHTAIQQESLTPRPDALLYLALRHSVLQEYAAAAFRILLRRGLVAPEDRLEREAVGAQTPTPWRILGRPLPGLAPTVGAYLDGLKAQLRTATVGYQVSNVPNLPADLAGELGEFATFVESLDHLAAQPAIVLGNLLQGTLDLASHRYDAWVTSYATKRLDWLRAQRPLGLYLGGYGWLEDLAPRPRQQVSPLPAGVTGQVYQAPGDGGFVHAPSLPQAATAALLRSGFLARRATGDAAALAVDLTSERVRLALGLLDGLRQGQSLGALLGYRFERGLHENHPGRYLDRYVSAFRKLAPLEVPAPTSGNEQAWGQTIETLPATNVVDGLALLRRYKAPQGDPLALPWGTANLLPAMGTADYNDCRAELARLEEAVDAVADLVLAEAVHQVAQGNPTRAGAALEAIATGEARPPAELEIIRTPRTGVGISQRLAVLFSGLPGSTSGWATATSRVRAEPFLNAWAGLLLGPGAASAVCLVEYVDPTTGDLLKNPQGQPWRRTISFSALGLAPVDVVYLARDEGEAQRSELEQRVILYDSLHPVGAPTGADLRLTFGRGPTVPAGTLSFAEVLEVARAVRRLFAGSRALSAGDLATPDQLVLPEADADVTPSGEPTTSPEKALRLSDRTDAAVAAFGVVHRALVAALPAAATDPVQAAVARDRLLDLAGFGIPGAVPLSASVAGAEERQALRTQAESVASEVADRLGRVASLEADHRAALTRTPPPTPATTRDYHLARLREVFGSEFRVLPRFRPANQVDLGTALAGSTSLQGGKPLESVTWFQRVARVRAGAGRLDSAMLYAEALGGASLGFTVAQLPYTTGDRWVGLDRTAATPAGARLSLVVHAPAPLELTRPLAGLLVDEWVEVVPNAEETTGVAFHYDAPGASPPQAVLLAVSPDERLEWDLETLEATVLSTLELAKLRTVDLSSLDADLGRYLPALYFARSPAGDTIATDFSRLANQAGGGD